MFIYSDKWPQCIIKGDRISEEQALEIIRRTDDFFDGGYGGNDKEFNTKVKEIVELPSLDDYISMDDFAQVYDDYETKCKKWKSNWGYVDTEYITNQWVSSAFIYGAHGWCHPDGVIEYHYNIGKYPSDEEVELDLRNIAKAFPFLRMTCTLMNGEQDYCNASRASWQIENGEVRQIDPIPYEIVTTDIPKDSIRGRKETYFSLEQIISWKNKIND